MKKTMVLGMVLVLGLTTYLLTPLTQKPSVAHAGENQAASASSLQEQLKMLEASIVPQTAEETVQLWAKAVQMRSGALQYALFTEQAKAGAKQSFESFHWATGASSPWVEGYKIVSGPEAAKDKYEVDFELMTSTGKYGTDRAIVGVAKIGNQWFIQSVAPASEKSVGIWNTPESINEPVIEKNFITMKTYDSTIGYRIQLPETIMNKIKIEQSTCKNEEGNPSCILFSYKDTVANTEMPLGAVIRLSKEQEKLPYYQEHPFIKKIGENKLGTFYAMYPSEHPYAGKEDSAEGTEWLKVLEALQSRIGKSIPTSEK
ncbi:hypothetical protein BRE01_44550 [Brevibacillus reuszeri]|uniref:Uncharacterized protein n=1 Tax=Brevibacillus reuszeri TaxID=54915 RepID=A0A0K9YKY8_9BACL|nr:hypothetical protein [Brevibacillus reuszeri]KNB69339.1 hypothetical protein ADS79_25890 [Brevibacillus reuszeri]MED1860360.1 hypothetical protein [Brevibacillus reuszeri]GED70753.1 hypothetical protein BRE01_44550 [Brevibacillus reuszeri]